MDNAVDSPFIGFGAFISPIPEHYAALSLSAYPCCVYLFHHRIFYIRFVLHPSIGLYPSICITSFMEPATRIELAYSAWKADVLPLNYTGTLPPRHAPGRDIREEKGGI